MQIHLFAEHALDTLLHRDCRRRACPASTLELQCHLAAVRIDRHNTAVATICNEVRSNLVEHDIDGIDGKGKLSLLTPCPSSSSLASLKGANHSSILLDRGRGMMMRKRRGRRRGSALPAEHVQLCDIVLAISAHMAGMVDEVMCALGRRAVGGHERERGWGRFGQRGKQGESRAWAEMQLLQLLLSPPCRHMNVHPRRMHVKRSVTGSKHKTGAGVLLVCSPFSFGLGSTTLSSAMARRRRPGARSRGGCVAGAHERPIPMEDLLLGRAEEMFRDTQRHGAGTQAHAHIHARQTSK